MTGDLSSVHSQYSQMDLSTRIESALATVGKNLNAITLDDMARFDELHGGGRATTRALAELAGLQPGTQVLDIGSGVGGPARTLTHEFGCRVVGLDMLHEFVEAAQTLTAQVGLTDRVSFLRGDAVDLPFEDQAFDAVWSQNVIMNVEDKESAMREAWRVLRSEGVLALQAVFAGPKAGLEYPVFWANSPEVNHLLTPDGFRQLMVRIGFRELGWRDVTLRLIERGRRPPAKPQRDKPVLGIDVVLDDVSRKRANAMRGFEEGIILEICTVYGR
jgi:SAM-dependent methyltransferase